nr:nucleotidyltransferase [Paenibacillus sp. 1011MAR3C5]
MMYGSFTKGEGDPYSDVEFYIFIADHQFDEFQSRQWVAEVASYDLMFRNDYDTEVVIFSNLIRGEFHFLPEAKLEVIKTFKPTGVFPDPEAMFIYDRTGKLRLCLDYLGGGGPDRLTAENVNYAFNNFVNAWLMGLNVMRRGELARSHEVLSQVQKFLLQLLRIRERNVERWLNSTKNLEKDLSAEAYREYALLTARLNQAELRDAYAQALHVAERLMAALRPAYDFELDEAMLLKLRAALLL